MSKVIDNRTRQGRPRILWRRCATIPWAAVSLLCLAAVAGAEERPLWVAVTRPALVQALEPLAEKRRQDGFEAVILTKPIAEALDGLPRRPDFLLLLGDYEPTKDRESWYLPAKRMKLYRWRATQAPEFASDTAWGDVDGDLIPDVPVGRIPARTREQAKVVVQKILTFERRPPTLEDLRLVIWAGAPGYGGMIDSMATALLTSCIRLKKPSWAQSWLICGDPNSPFCGWPPEQPLLFNRALKQGCIVAALMGHANPEAFFSMRFRNGAIGYTARHARQEMTEGEPTAPLLLFACGLGDFGRSSPCLAESLLFLPGGPVAAIGATTESHPLTNYFSGVCLLEALNGNDEHLGVMWLKVQRKAMETRDFLAERLLRDVEGKLEKDINVDKLKRDQILMYALLGDPATRLKLPLPLTASVVPVGSSWHWKAAKPEGATTLHVGFRPNLAPAPPAKGDLQEREAQSLFRAANATLAFTTLSAPAADEPWEGTWDKQGCLRLVATGPDRLWVAVLKLETPPTQPSAAERKRTSAGAGARRQ